MNLLEKKDLINERPLKNGYFQGTVKNDVDPLKANRIKVAIDGVTDKIKKDDLPWYVIKMPITSSANSKNDVPKKESRVIVYFGEEDIMNGKVVEAIVSIPPKSSV